MVLGIKRALPNMFTIYLALKYHTLPMAFEDFFSHPKNHLDLNDDLTLEHRINFINGCICLTINEFS